MNKLAKFQCYIITIAEVIKDTKLQKNVIFFVNDVTEKVLTSATIRGMDLKFFTKLPK